MKVAVLIALLERCNPNADVVFYSEGEWTREGDESRLIGDQETIIGTVTDLQNTVHLTS